MNFSELCLTFRLKLDNLGGPLVNKLSNRQFVYRSVILKSQVFYTILDPYVDFLSCISVREKWTQKYSRRRVKDWGVKQSKKSIRKRRVHK